MYALALVSEKKTDERIIFSQQNEMKGNKIGKKMKLSGVNNQILLCFVLLMRDKQTNEWTKSAQKLIHRKKNLDLFEFYSIHFERPICLLLRAASIVSFKGNSNSRFREGDGERGEVEKHISRFRFYSIKCFVPIIPKYEYVVVIEIAREKKLIIFCILRLLIDWMAGCLAGWFALTCSLVLSSFSMLISIFLR